MALVADLASEVREGDIARVLLVSPSSAEEGVAVTVGVIPGRKVPLHQVRQVSVPATHFPSLTLRVTDRQYMVADTSSQALKQCFSPLPPLNILLFYCHFSAKVLKRPCSYAVTKQPFVAAT